MRARRSTANRASTRFTLDDGRGWGTIGSGSMGGSGYGSGYGGGSISTVVTSRKDFRANAVFSPRLRTDADRQGRLTVKMPDSLTRFRIVALATASTHYFGKAESTIVTQRKINARTVAPRFLDQGDSFSLPVRRAEPRRRAAHDRRRGPRRESRRDRTAGQARHRSRRPARRGALRDVATQARGPASIQTIAVSGDFADASNVDHPGLRAGDDRVVRDLRHRRRRAAVRALVVPQDVFAEVGGVEVELASTQLQSLTDAYWYLYAYPYECAEQRSSRMLATTAMIDILDAFETPGRPTRAEIDADARHTTSRSSPRSASRRRLGLLRRHEVRSVRDDAGVRGASARHAAGTAMDNARAFVTKQERTLTRGSRQGRRDARRRPPRRSRQLRRIRSRSPPPRSRRSRRPASMSVRARAPPRDRDRARHVSDRREGARARARREGSRAPPRCARS